MLFSVTPLPPVVQADPELLLWEVNSLQRRQLHSSALETLRRAYQASNSYKTMRQAVFICLGNALEGVPQPLPGSEPKYWENLVQFAEDVTKGRLLSNGDIKAFVSEAEYHKAQLILALYEMAESQAYIDRAQRLLSGKDRVRNMSLQSGMLCHYAVVMGEKTDFVLPTK